MSLEICHLLLVALNAPLSSSCKRCLGKWGGNCCRQGGGGATSPHKMQSSALLTLPFSAKNKYVVAELQEPLLPQPCHQACAHQHTKTSTSWCHHVLFIHIFSLFAMWKWTLPSFFPQPSSLYFFFRALFRADLLHLEPTLQWERKSLTRNKRQPCSYKEL